MKHELRREMKRKLQAFGEGEVFRVGMSEEVLPKTTKTLFTYLPFGNEIDPSGLAGWALDAGIEAGAPCVRGEDLEFRKIDSADGPFRSGGFGIREPLADAPLLWSPAAENRGECPKLQRLLPLAVLVPALAYSRYGHRLGRGKGCYDRFLAALLKAAGDRRKEITLIGTCHDWQILSHVPAESHDIPVDCLLTGRGCIVCATE